MIANGWIQIALFSAIVIALTRPLGGYMTRVFAGERTFLWPLLRPVERVVYWCCGVDEKEEQHWLTYAVAMLLFSVAGFITLYALQRLQWYLPFNPQGQTGVAPDLAMNTSVSFVTNTNWQAYGGETTMGYLVQMAGLTVHNFVSAATGIAMALALIRGFVRREAKSVGNFWVDLTRGTLYLLIPISVVFALVLVWQGVPQNLGAYTEATTLEGAKQIIAQGPVASQEIIKELGTNGGGFFNANSSHPFENPNAVTNLIELVAIFAIGAGLTNVLGRMVRDERQGWAIFAAMGVLFLAGVTVCYNSEAHGNPAFTAFDVNSAPSAVQAGGNMEGKEVRFGPALSALWATVTTDTSCGAVNSMHDSFLPIGGMIPMVNIQLGEVIFGGVGSGLYGILAFAIVAMFVAGLMVGPHPRISRQKARSQGGQDDDPRFAEPASVDPRLDRAGNGTARRARRHRQCRSAWLQRDPLRLHRGYGQQWQRLCRIVSQYALLQHDDRGGDADRALHLCDPDAGGGWVIGAEEIAATFGRHLPDAQPTICRIAGRGYPDHRRVDLFPGGLAWTGDRAGRDEPGQALSPGRKRSGPARNI